jgi:hypothetical protein
VSLYLLLMEERYRAPVTAGLLWNVNQPAMQLVPRKQQELAPLLARRNALAAHLWQERPAAPPLLQVGGRRRGSQANWLHAHTLCAITWPAVAPANPGCTHPPRPAGPARLPALPQRRPVRRVPRNRRGRQCGECGHGPRPV